MLRATFEYALGCLFLLRLAWISRFRFRGPYWTWRLHTAFGRGYPASRLQLARALLDYARWMYVVQRPSAIRFTVRTPEEPP